MGHAVGAQIHSQKGLETIGPIVHSLAGFRDIQHGVESGPGSDVVVTGAGHQVRLLGPRDDAATHHLDHFLVFAGLVQLECVEEAVRLGEGDGGRAVPQLPGLTQFLLR